MALDPFAIIAAPSFRGRDHALKEGECFAVFDQWGDVVLSETAEQGIFHRGTRHVSRSLLRVGDQRPTLLSSRVRHDNALLVVDLTNADSPRDLGDASVPHGGLHIVRSLLIWSAACSQRLRLVSYVASPIVLTLRLEIDADFADIFEVRGMRRSQRGTRQAPRLLSSGMELAYDGLDHVRRRTVVELSRPPRWEGNVATFEIALSPREEQTLEVLMRFERGEARGRTTSFEDNLRDSTVALVARAAPLGALTTTSPVFDNWIRRSIADLRMMVTETAEGPYPYAGVPWFSAPFGRDGIITALETLWIEPVLAKGVLRFLAATQADSVDAARAAEPGKILHEMRDGEMAALGEIPFGRYYGSVDATPLFVVLAGEVWERTADLALVEQIWPHVERAVDWIDQYGDPDGDGFLEYDCDAAGGLRNQGWKDSADAIVHADGSLAEGPIALCEVQAYAFAAKREAARLARVLGHERRAEELIEQAETLRERFEEAFWLDELSTYALALDGAKRPCRVRSSNAGQCLFSGIVAPERARRLAETLFDDASFSGWGIRTLAASEAGYNPMSYHRGSIWPHDNALIALGLARYGLKPQVLALLGGLFEASLHLGFRLPELFCGHRRRIGEGPIQYPLACAPQAWAAGSVLLLLQACLGLSIDAPRRSVCFVRPVLPTYLEGLKLPDLRVGSARLALELHRYPGDVGIDVAGREGTVEVVNIK